MITRKVLREMRKASLGWIYICTQDTRMECLGECTTARKPYVLDRTSVTRRGGVAESSVNAPISTCHCPLSSRTSPLQAIGPRQVRMRCTQCLETNFTSAFLFAQDPCRVSLYLSIWPRDIDLDRCKSS
ncbi:hypothetical protein ElyMa_003264700 [Elysia marginata]|uniref:Uncharacterized protein n=1 Tax=Elysia marginata TaxID=1093978 RepID=A0AAV4J6V2_9GAST|nr:hypothetical protein ElyMa_003264700 [Elysia marginata]